MTGRTRIAIWVAALVAGVASAGVYAVATQDDDSTTSLDAMLEEPGTYEVPGIGTNAPVVGLQLPDVTLVDLDGNEVSTADLLGTPLVLNVWFSTCQPCKREMPHFAALDAEMGDQIRFVGINPNDTAEGAATFAAEFGVKYPTLLDRNGAFTSANGISTFPSTLFVAADGTIVRQKAGELTEDELRRVIDEELLG